MELAATLNVNGSLAGRIQLVQAAAKTWRRLKGANQLPLVIEGITFADGVAETDTANRAA